MSVKTERANRSSSAVGSSEVVGGHENQSSRAVRALLDASALLVAASSQGAISSGILDLAGNVIDADAYAIWRLCEDGWAVVAARGLSPSYRKCIDGSPNAPENVVRAIEDVLTAPYLEQFRNEYAAEGIRSMLVIPLTLSGDGSGTLTFYWRSPHRFSDLEVNYAEALANLCSAALNTSELQRQKERERKRLAFLAEASTILSSSLDYETTLNRVGQLAVPEVADWCAVHIVEDGVVNRIVVAHADPAMLRVAEDFSHKYPEEIHVDRGLGLVLRTGETEFYPHITEEMVVKAGRDPEHLQTLRSLRITSSILTPLISRGRILGAIRLIAAGEDRHFSADDLQLAKDLARRAATAIDNAQLHRAVLKQERELRLCHTAAHMGSWSWDWKKQEIFWSDEFKKVHGLPQDATPDYEAGSNLVHPDDRERVLNELREALASGAEQITSESRVITPDGRTLVVLSRGSIHRDEHGEPASIVGISLDVTEQRRSETALRKTEKLAAAGRMAATVAHEVNNPLEALTNLVFLASQAEGLPRDAKHWLDAADCELSRMAHIVRQTLGFYRESASPRDVDTRDIVNEVANLYRSRADARAVELRLQAKSGVTVFANAGELRQVLANLVSNAIDATERGGTVDLEVRRDASKVMIAVRDTGTGIRESDLPRIFEAFFTTKEEFGTGLGLWVSKGIVEKFKGTIEVASTTAPGRSGTTFTVTLPASSDSGEPNSV